MQGFTYLAKNVIGVGTYSKVHAVFPGATQGTTTWTAADSVTTPLPYASFVVTPVCLYTLVSTLHLQAMKRLLFMSSGAVRWQFLGAVGGPRSTQQCSRYHLPQ